MSHTWNFFRAGGVDQVRLESSDDLRNLSKLDKKLWVALACPVNGMAADSALLKLLDSDGDGRVRAPDVVAAVERLCKVITEPAAIFGQPKALPLAQIRQDTPEGKALLASARAVTGGLGIAEPLALSPAEMSDTMKIFTKMRFNGDGVVPLESAHGDGAVALIGDVLASVGSAPGRSGQPGVNAEKVDAFFKACEEFVAWTDAAVPVGALDAAGSEATSAAVAAVRAKVDDYFTRVHLLSFDPRGAAALNGAESIYTELANKTLAGAETEPLPLARIEVGRALPLVEGVNPAWSARISAFREAMKPILGGQLALTEGEWQDLKAGVAAYDAWKAAKAGAQVEKLGIARVRAILAAGKAPVMELIAADLAKEPEATAVSEVVRIVIYYCHLGQLLKNFVNFADFYSREEKAIFQAGTIFVDERSSDLVVRVQDAGRHASMAGLAGMYLAYFDCVRKSDGLTMSVAAAITDGDNDNLMVGRNGLFFDRQGRDYDATITRLVDNPISIRQAFWSPYKKFVRSIEEYVAKRAADADAKSNAALMGAAEKVATVDKAPPPVPSKIDVGTVAAIGVAVGGVTAALGAVLDAVFGLGWLMPLGLLGLVLFISGPSMLIAALKLRRRNLGPLLDADGWAINSQARVNIPFGQSLTQIAEIPTGSKRDLRDPFQQRRSKAPLLLLLLVVAVIGAIAYINPGLLRRWMAPAPVEAPAAAPAAPAP